MREGKKWWFKNVSVTFYFHEERVNKKMWAAGLDFRPKRVLLDYLRRHCSKNAAFLAD